MDKIFLEKFIIYGITGWCLEVLWTGFMSLINGDPKLTSTTSLWMFPIYGMVVFFEPFIQYLILKPIIIRGIIYMTAIFTVEYMTGGIIRFFTGYCPWDYTSCVFNINGLIRLDYAPVWFMTGLIYEKIYIVLQNW